MRTKRKHRLARCPAAMYGHPAPDPRLTSFPWGKKALHGVRPVRKKRNHRLVRCPAAMYGPPTPDFNVGGLIGVVSRSEKNATFLFLKAGRHSGNIEIGGVRGGSDRQVCNYERLRFFRTGREEVDNYAMCLLQNAHICGLYMS